MTLEQLVEEIKALPPNDQQSLLHRLNQEVSGAPEAHEASTELEVQRRLFEAGLLREIKQRSRDQQSFESYQPVTVRGKPISETIIEERR